MLSGTVPILPVFACPFYTGLFILYAAVCIHISKYSEERDLRLERELTICESDRCLELGFYLLVICVNVITVHPLLLSQLPTLLIALLIVDPAGVHAHAPAHDSARFSHDDHFVYVSLRFGVASYD